MTPEEQIARIPLSACADIPDGSTVKIYVAASRSLLSDAERLIAVLRRACHTITYDWTEAMRRNPPDDRCTDGVLIDECAADINGVLACDMFVLLAPESGGTGCWVELGLALASPRAPRIAIIGAFSRTIFRFAWARERRPVTFAAIPEFLLSMNIREPWISTPKP